MKARPAHSRKRVAIQLVQNRKERDVSRGERRRGVKAKLRSDQTTAAEANDIWAMDFVHDQLFDGTVWAYIKGVTLDFSRPGKPTDNAFIESFNGKFGVECLNANWFMSLDDARAECEAWRRDYNEVRPHSSIGNKTPIEIHRMAATPARHSPEEPGIS